MQQQVRNADRIVFPADLRVPTIEGKQSSRTFCGCSHLVVFLGGVRFCCVSYD